MTTKDDEKDNWKDIQSTAALVGFEHSGHSLETIKTVLGISEGRVKKLRDLNLLAYACGEEDSNAHQRFAGYDIAFLASARQRTLPIRRPTLICAMGKHSESDDSSRPSLFFDQNKPGGKEVVAEAMKMLKAHDRADLADALGAGKVRVTGYWRIADDDAKSLVDKEGIIVASYTGFILEGGYALYELPEMRHNGGRCFIVQPFDRRGQARYVHNYREPKVGPVTEYLPGQSENEENTEPS